MHIVHAVSRGSARRWLPLLSFRHSEAIRKAQASALISLFYSKEALNRQMYPLVKVQTKDGNKRKSSLFKIYKHSRNHPAAAVEMTRTHLSTASESCLAVAAAGVVSGTAPPTLAPLAQDIMQQPSARYGRKTRGMR